MSVKRDIEMRKHELNVLANRLKGNLSEFKRPLIIEFSGTPKAGKTTCVEAVSKFFKRHEIPTYVVRERAGLCPINDKGHLFFNTWTGNTSLAKMLESLEKRISVVILDRGIFDTLVWMNFHRNRKSVSENEFEVIENFFLMKRWRSLIDIVIALSVSPETSLEREYQNQITDLDGSIMNRDTLLDYNQSLQSCLEQYKESFNVMHVETSEKDALDGVVEIVETVLSKADDLVDEKIAVISRNLASKHMPKDSAMTSKSEIKNFLEDVSAKVNWPRRTQAEDDISLVQIVPVVVIYAKGASNSSSKSILIANMRGQKNGSMTNKHSTWVGGHMRNSDKTSTDTVQMFRSCLVRELEEELRICLDVEELPKYPKAIIWDTTKSRSVQHMAVVFEYELKAIDRSRLDNREFWESSDKSIFTSFHSLNSDITNINNLESWSKLFLKEIHGIEFPDLDQKQQVLF